VDAVAVHLNPGQELFQPDGDRDFRGVLDGISRFRERLRIPMMIKETGFGIAPSLVEELLNRGADWVNLAGSGGTNWVQVESHRLPAETRGAAEEFNAWGLPTAVLLAALEGRTDRVLASGGLRSGLDLAKAIALGARLSGFALPLVRAVTDGGVDGVLAYIERLETVLRNVMMLTGSRTTEDLRRLRLMRTRAFADSVAELQRADRPGSDVAPEGRS
jgi:isopentenyl-diphosphate delta-isomerase type 2